MAEFKRSRLERKSEEQITKKTVVLGFLTIAMFLLIIVFGLPLLVKFSVFLGEAKSRKEGNVQESVLPPLAPRLIIPFEATNSAKINISGLAEANTTVELLKNDVSLGKVEVSSSGDFVFSDVELNEGENTFSAVAMTDKSGSSEQSKVVTVILDQKAPELTMTNPSEESLTVDYADFDVIGKSEKNASVLVNNHVAMVGDEGNFKLKIQLNAGKNEIEIVVKDMAGNETKKKITITYDI